MSIQDKRHLPGSFIQSSNPLFPVTVSLKAAGNAPQLAKKKFLVEGDRTIGWMHQWLKKNLKCEPDESVVSSLHLAKYYDPINV